MNYAHNMSFVLIFLLWLLVNYKISQKHINIKLLTICVIINLFGFYATYTRGAWIGFMTGLPFLLLNKVSLKKIFLLLFFGLLSLVLVYKIAGSKVLREESDQTRIGLWKSALYMAKERPLTGVGYLNFEKHTIDIKKKYNLEIPGFGGLAHNSVLEIAASAGIIGLIIYLSWIVFWIKESFVMNIYSPLKAGLIFCFLAGGLTQSTIALGVNLFVIMFIFSLAEINTLEN